MKLSLEQTQALLQILESSDVELELEDFIAQHGYDEGNDDDLVYSEVEVKYIHRYNSGLKEDN